MTPAEEREAERRQELLDAIARTKAHLRELRHDEPEDAE